MNSGAFTFFVFAISAFVIAWALWFAGRGALTRRANPRPHALADSEHFWTKLDGRAYAFTAEQLQAARDRAKRLSA